MVARRSGWSRRWWWLLAAPGCADARLAARATLEPPPDLPYRPCPAETRVGEFSIERGADFTSAEGKVFDGVKPSLIPELVASDGDCRLLKLPRYLCDPACPVTTQSCGPDHRCLALPLARSVGTVKLNGLLVPVELTPNATTGAYRPTRGRLPHPAFEPGAGLQLQASGAQGEAFELWGWGVSELPPLPGAVDVEPGLPSAIAWPAPAQPGPARLHAALHIDNHGSSSAWIECDFADGGFAEIPASLILELNAQGRSGFPTLSLRRQSATSTEIAAGCVQLRVSSSINVGVSLSGLVSCNDDSMCPPGQSCRPLQRFCE